MYNNNMNKEPIPFLIVITDLVTFKDRTGTVLKQYQVGAVVEATADTGSYFVTSMGGIYHNEARRLNGMELITYAHQNGDGKVRFRQYVKDQIPAWATDLRIDEGDAQ